MNFTRWSARLPGTQRRAAVRSGRDGSPQAPSAPGSSVPTAREERPEPFETSPPAGPRGGAGARPPARELLARDVLDQVPGLVAVVHGPEHRIAYVNDAYTTVFGDRSLGGRARDLLPELTELGLLPLMDQVLRSGKPRTLKARRARGLSRSGHYTFTCTPIELSPADGPDGKPHADAAAAPAASGTSTGPSPDGAALGDASPDGAARPDAPPSGPSSGGAIPPASGGTATADGDGHPDGARDRAAARALPRAAGAAERRPPRPGAPRKGVMVFATDVTDQVEAAERLRTSERRQRETAVTLQRSLLPQKLEQPDDLRVAATYQPGGTDEAVGGDWYDVITLGAGRTALVIGDVMGRGVRAAAVMGQLRTAVRAYARLDLPPHEVLQLLDGLAAEIDPHQIATCLYAVHDPNENRLVHASAGHLPIIVRNADGTTRRASEPTGPPLGTGGWVHTSGSVPLEPGATAVLYTDGLVERRDADIDDGVSALEQALAGADGAPQAVCDRLIRALGVTADHDDDVAVLVLQHPARTGHDAELFHNAALDLLGGVEAAPRARAFASGVLTSWRFPTELHDLGVLAASELVANSLQHGIPPMRLRLRRTDRRLIVEVTDGDDHLPRRRRAEPVDESGRGISIIATIASSWGSRRTPGGGKAVWCEFALPDTCRSPHP
ncbi:SpoIIE family protein phosphatase [Streptomyces albus]|uniref:ATP-binding SpoIIE family protein phosphatase n=1 Tax=Streptomyces albus TaxID=1888 RepID=UPI0004C86AE6|nr:SpoIIE family protein phosphatase [Streptomyces albus]